MLEDKNILKEIKNIDPNDDTNLNNLKSITSTLTLIQKKYLPNYETTDCRNQLANQRAQLSTLQISGLLQSRLNFFGLFRLSDNIEDLKVDLQNKLNDEVKNLQLLVDNQKEMIEKYQMKAKIRKN